MPAEAIAFDWLRVVGAGLLIGLAVAAPIGAVNLICVRRTLAFGRLNGFLAGLGAAVGDGLFAIVVAFGLSTIADFVMRNELWLRLAGGLFLIAWAVRTYFSDPAATRITGPRASWAEGAVDLPHTVAATFALTVTNPATLIAFTAIMAGLANELGYHRTPAAAILLVVSVTAGSALWWFLLSHVVGRLHGQISDQWLRRLNQISAGLLGLLGFAVLIGLMVSPP